MKKIWVSLISLVFIAFSFAGISQNLNVAASFNESDNTVVISEPTDGILAVAGNTVIIEGDVNGPLFAAGQNITVEGDINGPIFVAGNTITIEGKVNGEVFVAGNSIHTVENAEFSRDVFIAGNQIILGSVVGRDLFVGGSSATIQNQVGRSGYISAETIRFSGNGQIMGDLNYQSEQEIANIDDFVQGEVNYSRSPRQMEQRMQRRRSVLSIVLGVLGSILSAVLIWLFLHGITQKRWITLSPQLIHRPILLLFIGFGLTVLTPLLIILMLISIIFSKIGLLIAILFTLILFLSKIVTASVISEYILKKRMPSNNYQNLISFTLAYGLLLLIGYIPIVGWIITLLCIFYTMGLSFREAIIRFQTTPI